MASPDEARVDEARDQSTIPAAPSDPTPRTDPAPRDPSPLSGPAPDGGAARDTAPVADELSDLELAGRPDALM